MKATRCVVLGLAILVALQGSLPGRAQALSAPADPVPAHEVLLKGAELIGEGTVSAYRKGGLVLLSIPPEAFGHPFIWYAEAVGLPAGLSHSGVEVASLLVQFERKAGRVLIRDFTTRAQTLAEGPVELSTTPKDEQGNGSKARRPINVALNALSLGAVIASLPVAAETPNGAAIVDVTKLFSDDIPSVSPRNFFQGTGLIPGEVDPAASYIDSLKAYEDTLNIRSHLTFLAENPENPIAPPQPVSFVVGHSLVRLPDEPMVPRPADPRVGYFETEFTVYEAESGAARETQKAIVRFRLEKAHPDAEVSDPVKPITFYVGPGVPDRWRPYIKAGIEQWQPAFEAAGFSNAIRAVDAPSPVEDPTFSVEDVSRSMVRWLTQPGVNAMGPQVIDPRSGETLSSHVLVWPAILDTFALYYHALFSTVDPQAAALPLPPEKQGELLQYLVAHEIGHALGLRHNHMASTAWTVAQLRDPAFANLHGPNSSIMAYGRFNQVAQPGDGITQLYPVIGPYDVAAIQWGYGDVGDDPVRAQAMLDGLARRFVEERPLFWGAGELVPERQLQALDPRLLMENVGAERIEATRLGIANILRSLKGLDEATGGDETLFRAAYDQMLTRHLGFLESVALLVGGTMPRYGEGNGLPNAYVPAGEQRRAVRYLLGEGARSLEPYRDPNVIERVAPLGGYRFIDAKQGELVQALLSQKDEVFGITVDKVAILESQSVRNADAYSPVDLGRDVAEAVWDDLATAPLWKRALQRAYLAATRAMFEDWTGRNTGAEQVTKALIEGGFSPAFAGVVAEPSGDLIYPAWMRTYLPTLKSRLDVAVGEAKGESDRLHFAEMAVQVNRLMTAAR